MDDLKMTLETLIDLDEPEALLTTIRRAAERKKGARWARLAKVLGEAEDKLLDVKPAPEANDQADAEARTE